MRFRSLLCISILLSTFSYAQNNTHRLYGTASQGGTGTSEGATNVIGTIFSMNQDGTDFVKLHDFDITNGSHPGGVLALLSNGKLAGVTGHGGKYGKGVLYTINRNGSNYKVLKHFVDTRPSKGVLFASDGMLYGATGSTPTAGGVIYRIKPDGTGYKELAHFEPLNFGTIDTWDSPTQLIELPDGDLVGATYYGINNGFVFRMAKNANSFSIIYTCTWDDGDNPVGLIRASDDRLYMTTQTQGGSIISMKTDGTDAKVIFKWTNTAEAFGHYPHWGLTESPDGSLYGTTMWRSDLFDNSGVVFKISKDGSGYTPLYVADGKIGTGISHGVIFGANNRIFTGFMTGGTSGVGTIVSMNDDGTDFKVLKNFDYESGAIPGLGNLMLAPASDVEIKPYFTLSGLITKPGAFKLKSGNAKLFYLEGGLAAKAFIKDGVLKLDSICEGKYFLQIVPQGNEGKDVFPTYYMAAKLHKAADTLYLKSDSTLNIQLLPKKQSTKEDSRIKGNVVSDDSSVANTGGRLTNSNAVADYPVYLLDEKSEVKDVVLTDEEGNFKFMETSNGNYRLTLDIVGATQQTTSSLLELNDGIGSLDITARIEQKGTIKVEYSINVITGIQERVDEFYLYPNPVLDKIIVKINTADFNEVRYLNLYSANGKLVKQFNQSLATQQLELDVSELPEGFYLLQVVLKTRTQQIKFIKAR